MDAETAAILLGRAGFPVDPRAVRVEAREDCWAAWLPGDRMAWFPMNPAGALRLATERRVLDLLAARCSFRAPRVVHADEAAGWQLRLLMLIVTIGGIFIVSILIGTITSGLEARLTELQLA